MHWCYCDSEQKYHWTSRKSLWCLITSRMDIKMKCCRNFKLEKLSSRSYLLFHFWVKTISSKSWNIRTVVFFLCLLCNSWVTKGCCDIREASVTKVNILACLLFTWFCVHLNFNPFSLSYDDGKAVGLDALTGDSKFSNKLRGPTHGEFV